MTKRKSHLSVVQPVAVSGTRRPTRVNLLELAYQRIESLLIACEVRPGTAVLEDRFSGERREIPCAVLVHCGHRVPAEELYLAAPGTPRAGDAVAPRGVLEAVLEARRAAVALDAAPPAPGTRTTRGPAAGSVLETAR